jgi:hypothetical protein
MSDFRSSDGKSHESAGARDAHQAELNDQATFEKAVIGATAKGGGILAKIFLVAPLILSFVGSFIFGLLFFAGIVGRIIQTALVGMVVGLLAKLLYPFGNAAIMTPIVTILVALLALWYYFSHYFTMRVYSTDNGEFSDGFADALAAGVVFATAIVPPFALLFYGGLVAYIVFSITKSATIGIIIFVVAVVGAIAYYVFQSLKVRKDAEEAKKKDKDKRPRMVTFVCGIVAVAIACLLPFNEMVAQNKGDKGITAKRAALGAKTVGDLQIIQNAAKTGIIIERYVGKGEDVVIPAQFDGLPVLIIGSDAFAGNDLNITSVVIPENVTDIAGRAFRYNKLTSVTFPRSLQRVGYGAFENCTSLVNVTIPSGLTIQYVLGERIGETPSFKGCTGLSAESKQALRDSGYKVEF